MWVIPHSRFCTVPSGVVATAGVVGPATDLGCVGDFFPQPATGASVRSARTAAVERVVVDMTTPESRVVAAAGRCGRGEILFAALRFLQLPQERAVLLRQLEPLEQVPPALERAT